MRVRSNSILVIRTMIRNSSQRRRKGRKNRQKPKQTSRPHVAIVSRSSFSPTFANRRSTNMRDAGRYLQRRFIDGPPADRLVHLLAAVRPRIRRTRSTDPPPSRSPLHALRASLDRSRWRLTAIEAAVGDRALFRAPQRSRRLPLAHRNKNCRLTCRTCSPCDRGQHDMVKALPRLQNDEQNITAGGSRSKYSVANRPEVASAMSSPSRTAPKPSVQFSMISDPHGRHVHRRCVLGRDKLQR